MGGGPSSPPRIGDRMIPNGRERETDPSREHGPVELPMDGVLDLHTFDPKEVKSLIPEYVAECRRRGVVQLRIIHGKGTGVLREIVLSALAKIPEVASFKPAEEQGGGWGATIVDLNP